MDRILKEFRRQIKGCKVYIVILTVIFAISLYHRVLIPVLIHYQFLDYTELVIVADIPSLPPTKDSNDNIHAYKHKALLTLITSFKNIPSRLNITENVLKSWPKLPGVIPVVYIDDGEKSDLHDKALSLGWTVFTVPKQRLGYPVLKNMIMHALSNIQPSSYFIGYANSDILFTTELVSTLTFIRSLSDLFDRNVFITGKKINTLVSDVKFDSYTGLVTNKLPHSNGVKYGHNRAFDYFIYTTKTDFNWKEIPDFVIGKPAYDNWLVIKAIETNMETIDCTQSIMALHQIVKTVDSDKGWFAPHVCMNRDLIDPMDMRLGNILCLNYIIKYVRDNNSFTDKLALYKRTKFEYTCNPIESLKKTGIGSCSQLVSSKTLEDEIYEVQRFT